MPTIQIYEPALCCPTGVCGPDPDAALARFAADVEWLRQQGCTIERFNLAQQPGAFAGSPFVKAALEERGTDALPIVAVDGRVAFEGVYPSREALAALAGVTVRVVPKVRLKTSCDPGSGCC
jgi:hypothetical protein